VVRGREVWVLEEGEEGAPLVLAADVLEELPVLLVGGCPPEEAVGRRLQLAKLVSQGSVRDLSAVALVPEVEGRCSPCRS
jgi:hypothetical protein